LLNKTVAIASKGSKLLSSFNISVKFNYSNNIVKITHCLISKHLVLTHLDVIQKRTMEPGVCDVFGVLLSHKWRAKYKHKSYIRRRYKFKNRK